MLTSEEIDYWSTNRQVYERGRKLYEAGAVPKVHAIQQGTHYTIRGYVEGSQGDAYYNVLEIDTSNPDDVTFECECPAAYQYEGACKHSVAMMFKLQEMSRRGTLQTHHVDKVSGQALLESYETRVIRNLDKPRTGTITVVPRLVELGDGFFGISVSVGEDKLYIVKDMGAFIQNILDEEQAGYGKYLSFMHCVEAFTTEAKPLVALLIRQFTDRESVLGQIYGGKLYSVDKKVLPLTQSGLDAFFDLYVGREVEVQDERGRMPLLLQAGNPHFTFRIDTQGADFKVYTATKHYQVIAQSLHTYVWIEQGFYRVDAGFIKRVIPVLQFMQEVYPPQLSFDEEGFKRFTASVLGYLKRYASVESPRVLTERYTPPELTIRVYLDYETKQEISARVIFDYEGYTFNPFENDNKHYQARALEQEYYFNQVLETYGFRAVKGRLYLEDEDAIYTFLREGVEALMEVSEVHIQDALKDLKVSGVPIGRIGIKMKSELFELKLEDLHMSPQEIQAVLQAYRQKKKYYRLKNGAFVDLMSKEIEVLDDMQTTLELEEEDFERGFVEVRRYRAYYLEQLLAKQLQIEVKKDKATRGMLHQMKHYADEEESVPLTLEDTLRSYQKTGYLWLNMLAQYGLGGILADDMGLGKTLQVITLLLKAKEEGKGVSLVVAPTSLVLNWQKEFEKFAPGINLCVLNGAGEARRAKLGDLQGKDVVITSYDALKRDREVYESTTFTYCIADEAHYIKNPHTQNAKVIKSIKSGVCFALTGTPIENNLSELWSLFDFCMPGFLGTYHQFKATYETPIMRMQDSHALQKLQQTIAPFILRRLKKEVLRELPPKTETILYNEMEVEQEVVYKAHLALVQKELNQVLEAQGLGKSHMKILAMLTRLRQLCCHPQLYLEDYEGDSSKLSQCMELVEECVEGGHKVLIFSQFTTMLEKIGEALQREGIAYYVLTGQTKAERRMEMVEAFNQDEVPVFLISLKAGGTGLNLTGADCVIHYDPWWNVSSENQATDRAYRIGQDKPVQVFKLITKGSIEEKIKALQDKKIVLAEKLLETDTVLLSQMDEDAIRSLFS